MRKVTLLTLLFVLLGCCSSSDAAYYVAGEFNGWNAGSDQMTDNGDGTYTFSITSQPTNQRQEFKITQGDWSWNVPSANSWYFTDSSGSVEITYTPGPVDDGWSPSENRIGVSTDPGTWTVAGAFQSWNNADPGTAMTHVVDGIYKYTATLTNGTQEFKPVVTGSWDSISSDARSINTANMLYSVAGDSEDIDIYVDAFNGVVGINMDVDNPSLPHDPDPNNLAVEVPVEGLELSWAVALVPSTADPNIMITDPNIASHKVYLRNELTSDPNDPNMPLVDTIPYVPGTPRQSHTPTPELNQDGHYTWRVDMVLNGGAEIQGPVWTFYTETSAPTVTDTSPSMLVVPAGDPATFTVTATSSSPVTYQWYRGDVALSDGGDISGAETDTLTVSDVQLEDTGSYYCVVNNDSQTSAQSASAVLDIRRLLAYWPFENDSYDSIVPGSPTSININEPDFTSDAVVGNALEFKVDPNNADNSEMLIIDPENASYFDICNQGMTVELWIKSSYAVTWGAIVSRNGENADEYGGNGDGWQFRHNGTTLNKISFSTEGVGSQGSGGYDDGRASDRPVYDGQWHYLVATYDGTEKAVYIDGVVCRLYNGDDGSIAYEGEPATGMINYTPDPVAMPSRVVDGVAQKDKITPCILDEVKIYNYAVDATAVAETYAELSGSSVCPVPLENDLTGDCVINLDDFALIASGWLTDTSVKP